MLKLNIPPFISLASAYSIAFRVTKSQVPTAPAENKKPTATTERAAICRAKGALGLPQHITGGPMLRVLQQPPGDGCFVVVDISTAPTRSKMLL
mmetsp:Transcript_8728/g.12883  ORF Transcript_8728/g.12883 Transcript_8728/m.12883 type:complete len:94 (+) Transcript_8728:718-999(+)